MQPRTTPLRRARRDDSNGHIICIVRNSYGKYMENTRFGGSADVMMTSAPPLSVQRRLPWPNRPSGAQHQPMHGLGVNPTLGTHRRPPSPQAINRGLLPHSKMYHSPCEFSLSPSRRRPTGGASILKVVFR